MFLVKPSHKILTNIDSSSMLQLIELAGRTCYKSEDKITPSSSENFVKMVLGRGHHSVIEHANISIKFICDRGVTHELVRHRLAAYSQESTRYCNYKGGVTFVIPPWLQNEHGRLQTSDISTPVMPEYFTWYTAMEQAEYNYLLLLEQDWSPQQARSVLPNSTKTEIVATCNIREWRHIFTLRCSQAAHPQMRELMIPTLEDLRRRIPVVFDDVPV